MDEQCALCEAIEDSLKDPGKRALCNTPIVENDLFVILPSVGPLFPGHIMAVSKHHYPSLAAMGHLGVDAYLDVLELLRKRSPRLLDLLLETEHGGVSGGRAGPCIVHTHVNLIPGATKFAGILDGTLPLMEVSQDLHSLIGVGESYFFTRTGEETRFYSGLTGESQLVRRLIATAQNRDDWNWAIFEKEPWIVETLRMWEAAHGAA